MWKFLLLYDIWYMLLILDDNKIYQWGNLFSSRSTIKTDSDMHEVISTNLFDGHEVEMLSAKFKLAGAIVKH
jgi:hypothetical protein